MRTINNIFEFADFAAEADRTSDGQVLSKR